MLALRRTPGAVGIRSLSTQVSRKSASSRSAPIVRRSPRVGITPLGPACGAVITDLDLSDHQDEETVHELHALLLDHGVLFFPRDQLSHPLPMGLQNAKNVRQEVKGEGVDLVSFASRFGPLEGPHPVYSPDPTSPLAVIAHDENNLPDGAEWHTDCSWSVRPPFASVLQAQHLPPQGAGGDTLWLSTARAFDRLPAGLKDDLRELTAVHDMGSFRNSFVKNNPNDVNGGINEGHAKFGSAVHPIVLEHPTTGQPCLYVNEAFTNHVVGLMADESRRLLSYLFQCIERPDNQVRWRWSTGDVAIWDNWSTQHYACADYTGHRRRMHRLVVEEDRLGGGAWR